MNARKSPRVFTEDQKLELAGKWVQLRRTMGATEAARELGCQCEALRLWSKAFGLEVPARDLALTNAIPKDEMDERARLTLQWKALRESGVPAEAAAERVGLCIKKIQHCARVRGIEIGHLVRGRGIGRRV